MKQMIALCCGLFLVAASGCGSSPDSLVQEQIQTLNDMATALENDAPEAELEELTERLKEINKELDAHNLSAEEKQELAKRHQTELTAATQRLGKAMLGKAFKNVGQGLLGQ